MKTRVYRYFTWLCLGLCSACSSGISGDEDEPGQAREVVFRISRSDDSFARATVTSFEIGDSIGVYAVKHGDGSLLAPSGNQAHNAKWVKTDEGWKPASLKDKIVFPQDGTELDFYAYYPYSRDAVNPGEISMGVMADQTTGEGRNASDWMTAANTRGVNEGEVDLVFRHLMASVEVEVRGGAVVVPDESLEVQMTEVCLTNSFNLGTGMFVAGSGTGAIDMWCADAESFTYKAFVPAQTLEAGTAVFWCLLGGKVYVYRGEEIVLEQGNRTRFVFTLKSGSES